MHSVSCQAWFEAALRQVIEQKKYFYSRQLT